MKQQGKLTLASGKALLAAKSEGEEEKKKNGFSKATLEVSLSGGGRLLGQGGNRSRSLAACIRALCCSAASSSHAGAEPGLRAKGGSRREQIGFTDRKRGMRNARRNFD